ncbi:MAG: HAMP domain-containing histidine kinase [Christensenellaceae bacterium]|nr:HAMP domain-containing histidine kinase [Christensenellaceae bacterium]
MQTNVKRKLIESAATKAVAVILSTVFFAAAILITAATMYLADCGMYNDTKDSVMAQMLRGYLLNIGYHAARVYAEYGAEDVCKSIENTNLEIILKDAEGQVRMNTKGDQKTQLALEDIHFVYWHGGSAEQEGESEFYVSVFVLEELEYQDEVSSMIRNLDRVYSNRFAIPFLALFCAVAALSLFIFLFCGAGHRLGIEGISLSFVDKIPLDVLILAYVLFFSIIIDLYAPMSGWLLLIIIYPLSLLFLLSAAVRIKAGIIFKNTVIYRLGTWLWRGIRYVVKHIPLVPRVMLLIAFATAFEFIFIILSIDSFSSGAAIIWWLIWKCITIPVVIIAAIALGRLKKDTERIASGELDFHVDTRHMRGSFRSMGESLNNISVGMSKAVDERMRSERFKTELITNVSHDIKTPLTSIINYVDLMKKHGSTDEKLTEYIGIIDRQSARLKKLIEDLTEASKASTGSLAVNIERCDLNLLLTQSICEYQEKLRESGIEPVANYPENSVYVLADGRHLWRIFDNLLGNVVKYAQRHTRLYVDIGCQDGYATVTLRNISGSALNISGEELLERFVRGDSSRHTEGSGLGLNIAKSLAELQGGSLDIIVDGDLFKTVVMLRACN